MTFGQVNTSVIDERNVVGAAMYEKQRRPHDVVSSVTFETMLEPVSR